MGDGNVQVPFPPDHEAVTHYPNIPFRRRTSADAVVGRHGERGRQSAVAKPKEEEEGDQDDGGIQHPSNPSAKRHRVYRTEHAVAKGHLKQSNRRPEWDRSDREHAAFPSGSDGDQHRPWQPCGWYSDHSPSPGPQSGPSQAPSSNAPTAGGLQLRREQSLLSGPQSGSTNTLPAEKVRRVGKRRGTGRSSDGDDDSSADSSCDTATTYSAGSAQNERWDDGDYTASSSWGLPLPMPSFSNDLYYGPALSQQAYPGPSAFQQTMNYAPTLPTDEDLGLSTVPAEDRVRRRQAQQSPVDRAATTHAGTAETSYVGSSHSVTQAFATRNGNAAVRYPAESPYAPQVGNFLQPRASNSSISTSNPAPSTSPSARPRKHKHKSLRR